MTFYKLKNRRKKVLFDDDFARLASVGCIGPWPQVATDSRRGDSVRGGWWIRERPGRSTEQRNPD